MERTAKGVIERSKYEDKYGVEVKQDEVTGETSVRDREKDDVDLAAEQGGNSRHFGPWAIFWSFLRPHSGNFLSLHLYM